MSQLKTDTRLTLFSRIPIMLLSFLSMVFLTRLLGPEGNGVYTFTMAVLNLLITVIGFQLDGSLPIFLARDKSKAPGIFSATALLIGLSVAACSLVLLALTFLVPGGRSWIIPEHQPAKFFFGFLLLAFILRRNIAMIQASLRGLFKYKLYNLYAILCELIPALGYAGVLGYTIVEGVSVSLISTFLIILAMDGILMVVGIILIRKTVSFQNFGHFSPFLKPMLQFSFKNLLSASGHYMNKRLDVWFVHFYRGPYWLGQYGLATQIANFISEAMNPITNILVIYVARNPLGQHKEIVERSARLTMTIALLACAFIVGTSWLFIPLLFGSGFRQAIPASCVLAIGILFISQRLVFTGYFKAIDQQHVAVKAAWGGVCVTVILDLLLIPKFGIIGASWATITAYGTSAVYLIYTAKQKLSFELSHIFLIRKSDVQWLFSRDKLVISDTADPLDPESN